MLCRGGLFALCFSLLPSAIGSSSDNSLTVTLDVPPSALSAVPVAANWLSYNGDYTGRRYTSLNQITTQNVDQL
jgi:alcohol dehydrogenase (cytochrome c)